jgi:hypothetical protein
MEPFVCANGVAEHLLYLSLVVRREVQRLKEIFTGIQSKLCLPNDWLQPKVPRF